MAIVKALVTEDEVAPFTGAWIETTAFLPEVRAPSVAPFTGAWIETPEDDLCGRR